MTSILVTGGTVITMDPQRRVIEDGAVAIDGDRIAAVGLREDIESNHSADQTIDASRMVVMPGLIDGHGHAGHGLVKTMGSGVSELWYEACAKIYAEGSTEEFWRAEAMLTSLERLKFGVTCGMSFLGGGDSVMRTDDPVFGDLHCQATESVGIREFVAVGPRRPPYPSEYIRWEGGRETVSVSFDRHLEASEELIRRWHGGAEGRMNICMMLAVHNPEIHGAGHAEVQEARVQAQSSPPSRCGICLASTGSCSPRTATPRGPSSSLTRTWISWDLMPCYPTPRA